MWKRELLKGLIVGTTVGSAIAVVAISYCNYKIRKLEKSVILLNEIDETKNLNKVLIIKGAVTSNVFRPPINFGGVCELNKEVVHCFYAIFDLDMNMKPISFRIVSQFKFTKFPMGTDTQITVEMDDNTNVFPMVFYEKVVELDLNWWRHLLAHVTSRIACFEKKVISIVPAKQDIFVGGLLTKDTTNNRCILKADNIYTSQDQIAEDYKHKRRNMVVLLGCYSAILIVSVILRRSNSSWLLSPIQVNGTLTKSK